MGQRNNPRGGVRSTYPRLLESIKNKNNKCVAIESYCVLKKSSTKAAVWADARGLQTMARFELNLCSPAGARTMAMEYCRLCQFLWDVLESKNDHTYCSSDAGFASYKCSEDFLAFGETLSGCALTRWRWLRDLKPRRC